MKKFLFESPINDYFDDNTKSEMIKLLNQKNKENKEKTQKDFYTIMGSLSQIESYHRDELLNLAIKLFYVNFPDIKKDVDDNKLTLDANFTERNDSSLRTVSQSVPQQLITKAKEKDPDFEERVKSRHINNSLTQGSAWDAFDDFKQVESYLNNIDPKLVEYYNQFKSSASLFYNNNESSLKSMANSSSGRIAWCDVVDNQNGGLKLIARAPNFPLLLHELNKGGNLYNSLRYTHKDEDVHNALIKSTDTHTHEIDGMKYGQILRNKIEKIWDESVIGYEKWMSNSINRQYFYFSSQYPKLYNEIILGILNEDSEDYYKYRNMLVHYTNIFVNDIKKQFKDAPKQLDVKQIENEKEFNKLIKEGDRFMYNENYTKAIEAYRKAILIKETPELIFKITVAQGDLENQQGNEDNALKKYKFALSIKPNDESVKEKINQIENPSYEEDDDNEDDDDEDDNSDFNPDDWEIYDDDDDDK